MPEQDGWRLLRGQASPQQRINWLIREADLAFALDEQSLCEALIEELFCELDLKGREK